MYKFKHQNNRARAKALALIYEDILENIGIDEVKRYYKTFKHESDYNVAQFGNLLVYYYQVRKFLIDCGFSKYDEQYKQSHLQGQYKIKDDEVWQYYLMLVRVVVDTMINNPQDIKWIED